MGLYQLSIGSTDQFNFGNYFTEVCDTYLTNSMEKSGYSGNLHSFVTLNMTLTSKDTFSGVGGWGVGDNCSWMFDMEIDYGMSDIQALFLPSSKMSCFMTMEL